MKLPEKPACFCMMCRHYSMYLGMLYMGDITASWAQEALVDASAFYGRS
jgi:hypothetical protein